MEVCREKVFTLNMTELYEIIRQALVDGKHIDSPYGGWVRKADGSFLEQHSAGVISFRLMEETRTTQLGDDVGAPAGDD